MSQEGFRRAITKLCTNEQKFRDRVKNGEEILRNAHHLTEDELFVLALCGVQCGHVDPYTGDTLDPPTNTADTRNFRKVLAKLCTDSEFRRKVVDAEEELEDHKMNQMQLDVMHEAGKRAGHIDC